MTIYVRHQGSWKRPIDAYVRRGGVWTVAKNAQRKANGAWSLDTDFLPTPLSNVQLTLGPHEIVFRHPQFGERRMQTTAKLGEAGRLSVDMRK